MTSLLILIPIALLLFILIIGLLYWSIQRGQFDDLDSPAIKILLDKDPPTES